MTDYCKNLQSVVNMYDGYRYWKCRRKKCNVLDNFYWCPLRDGTNDSDYKP